MSTRQSQLFLLLVQVMIYSRNVRGHCFINTATKCTSSLTRDKAIYKFNYKFSLDGSHFNRYFCDHQLSSVEKNEVAIKKSSFTLTPQGAGKGCVFFRYEFKNEWLDLTAEDVIERKFWLRFGANQDSEMWDLPFQSFKFDGMAVDGNNLVTNNLGFRSGDSTSLSSRFVLQRVLNTYQPTISHIYKSRIEFIPDQSLLIFSQQYPTPIRGGGVGLEFVMGKVLPPSVLFAFTKKTENERAVFAVMLGSDGPYVDPDAQMVTGTIKKTKLCSPFNCFKNQERGSSSQGNAGTAKKVVIIDLDTATRAP